MQYFIAPIRWCLKIERVKSGQPRWSINEFCTRGKIATALESQTMNVELCGRCGDCNFTRQALSLSLSRVTRFYQEIKTYSDSLHLLPLHHADASHSTDDWLLSLLWVRVWIPGTNFIYFLKWKKLSLSLVSVCRKKDILFSTSEIQLRDWNSLVLLAEQPTKLPTRWRREEATTFSYRSKRKLLVYESRRNLSQEKNPL